MIKTYNAVSKAQVILIRTKKKMRINLILLVFIQLCHKLLKMKDTLQKRKQKICWHHLLKTITMISVIMRYNSYSFKI